MSTYLAPAYDPVTGTVREATWIDDYFGRHRYGVQFDKGGPVYRPEDVRVEAAGAEMARLRAQLDKAREALRSSQSILAQFRDPDFTVSAANVYAHICEAEVKCRVALAEIKEQDHDG